MKEFRVTFHFGKDDSLAFITEAESRESIIESIKVEEFGFDFSKNNAMYRVNLKNVNFVSVVELKS